VEGFIPALWSAAVGLSLMLAAIAVFTATSHWITRHRHR
jgi:hypothetical protein